MTRRKAFTLVELLVVIGIIVLLISILLPVISKVRNHSERMACASNLRQLGIAFLSYAHENKGYFPQPGYYNDGTKKASYSPADWIHWESDRDIKESLILPYIGKNLNVLRCPSGVVNRPAGEYQFSYSVNYQITGWTGDHKIPKAAVKQPCKVTQIHRPVQKILLIEENSETIDDGAWASDDIAARISIRHDNTNEHSTTKIPATMQKRGNVIFADGHYSFIQRITPVAPYHNDPRYDGPMPPGGTPD